MSPYIEIEEVKAEPEFGNCGRPGWGFTLWNDPQYSEPHRPLLERLAKQYPACALNLPEHYPKEDCVEGSLTWQSHTVMVWYEEVLTHLRLWSADHDAMQSLRTTLIPLAKEA